MCTLRGFNCRNQLALLGSAIWEEGLAVENAAERGAVPMMRNADLVAEREAVPIMPNAPNAELVVVKGELKKMNKQLRQLIELKKQANLMAGVFFLYNCSGNLSIAHQALEVVTRDPLLQIHYSVYSVMDSCTCSCTCSCYQVSV